MFEQTCVKWRTLLTLKNTPHTHTQKTCLQLMHDDTFWHWSNSKRLGKECSHKYEQCKQSSSKFFRPFIELRWLLTTGPSCSKGGSSIHQIAQLVFLIIIRWIVIYPVDSAIQLLNNRGQENPGSKYPCINPWKTWQRTSLSGATWRKANQSLSSWGTAAAENKYTARKSRKANTWAP